MEKIRKQEVYRNFDGKLGPEIQSGYIIYDIGNYYEVEWLSVESHKKDLVRIRKELLSKEDFKDREKLADLQDAIEYGRGDYGQCYYRSKWWSYNTICRIQQENQEEKWKRYV